MSFRFALAFFFALLVGGCTVFSPYVPTAKIEKEVENCKMNKETQLLTENCNTSTRDLSNRLREEFEASSSSLSRVSNSMVVAISGLIGFGAYKGVSDGGGHQIAALGAGAGTLYGAHSALYKPTREQLFTRGAGALNCLDEIYQQFDSAEGERLSKKYTSSPYWNRYEQRYKTAYEIAKQHESIYRSKVIGVAIDLNILLSNDQPSPSDSHARISSAVNGKVAEVKSLSKSENKGGTENLFSLITGRAGFRPEIDFPDLERWVINTEIADRAARKRNPDNCNINGNIAIRILGVNSESILKLKVGEKKSMLLAHTSNVIGVDVYTEGDQSDKDAISARIITERGAFALEIEAKTATTKPVTVQVTDFGNGQASSSVTVEVEQAPQTTPTEPDVSDEQTETDEG